jgi:ribonuclease G
MKRLVADVAKRGVDPNFENARREKGLTKEGQIESVLTVGQPIIVQIVKEAISTKGPRLTADISLAGRHVVLVPLSNKISISQKIRSNLEKKRLKAIAQNLLPPNYGLIIRTAAKDKSHAEIEEDIASLIAKWESVLEKIKVQPNPSLLAGEMNRTTVILRDLLNGSFTNIYVDDQATFDEVREYIRSIEPEKEKIVKYYKGKVPIFDNFDITRQIKSAFGKTVSFKRGAYLIIEHTEALHVIDVNSGKRAKIADNQEDTAMEVNCDAVKEIARQLRLRDMGGIVVVDFIDMHLSENRNALFKMMKEAMSEDRAKHTVLPLSKFGLMQITRQRVRPETKIEINDVCPTCRGAGRIAPTVSLEEQIETQLAYLTEEKGERWLELHTGPYVAAYLCKGLWSVKWRWALKYKCYLKVVSDMSMGYVESQFYNRRGEQLM